MSEQAKTAEPKVVDRPEFVTNAHLAYLDTLRESGIINMLGAAPYLRKAFRKLSEAQSTDVVLYWMKTFIARHRASA